MGHVSVYQRDESESRWMHIKEDIEGEAAGNSSGFLMSLLGDGNNLSISSPNGDGGNVLYSADDASGNVKVFVLECCDDSVY